MTKVTRTVLANGDYHEVACAVLADGVTSPVTELLELLSSGMWEDPHESEFPDEGQARVRQRFLAAVEYLAQNGELSKGYNRLDAGIWEFKIEALRVTFFDTPGDGTYSPKLGADRGYSWDGRSRIAFPDDFDEYIRVGHYFGKQSQRTLPEDIARSIEVREEDLAHDRH